MLEQVLSSPLFAQTAKLVQQRIGRPLEPFDIWYNGFRPRSAYTEAQLDEIVRKKYPTADAYKQDIPNLLVKLGFTKERADYVANNIVVDPAGDFCGLALCGTKFPTTIGAEDIHVIRFAEVVLIKAEAMARQGGAKLPGAVAEVAACLSV